MQISLFTKFSFSGGSVWILVLHQCKVLHVVAFSFFFFTKMAEEKKNNLKYLTGAEEKKLANEVI